MLELVAIDNESQVARGGRAGRGAVADVARRPQTPWESVWNSPLVPLAIRQGGLVARRDSRAGARGRPGAGAGGPPAGADFRPFTSRRRGHEAAGSLPRRCRSICKVGTRRCVTSTHTSQHQPSAFWPDDSGTRMFRAIFIFPDRKKNPNKSPRWDLRDCLATTARNSREAQSYLKKCCFKKSKWEVDEAVIDVP